MAKLFNNGLEQRHFSRLLTGRISAAAGHSDQQPGSDDRRRAVSRCGRCHLSSIKNDICRLRLSLLLLYPSNARADQAAAEPSDEPCEIRSGGAGRAPRSAALACRLVRPLRSSVVHFDPIAIWVLQVDLDDPIGPLRRGTLFSTRINVVNP